MFTSLAIGVLGLATQVLSLATIEAKGSKFFKSTGEQFYIKGTFTSAFTTLTPAD